MQVHDPLNSETTQCACSFVYELWLAIGSLFAYLAIFGGLRQSMPCARLVDTDSWLGEQDLHIHDFRGRATVGNGQQARGIAIFHALISNDRWSSDFTAICREVCGRWNFTDRQKKVHARRTCTAKIYMPTVKLTCPERSCSVKVRPWVWL